jgi:hypothetical protein
MNLPDPQTLSDAHGLTWFAASISEPAVNLMNGRIKNPQEFEKLKSYFQENVEKLKNVIAKLEAQVSGVNIG